MRDDCQTEADFDRAFDGFDIVKFGGFANVNAVGF
jgi:hypothetical protein